MDQRQAEPIDAPSMPTTAQWGITGTRCGPSGPETATELFWHDAPPDVIAWANARLRPQCYRAMTETSPLAAWPDVPSSYIACRDDRATNPAWELTAARERLGVEAVEIDGAHSPMLSRPAELAEVLHELSVAGAPKR